MPRKCNDHDLVTYSELKPVKGPAPPVHAIPDFDPIVYIDQNNTPCLPTTIDSSDPEALFRLFFEDSTIEMLVTATNENAIVKRSKYSQSQHARPWHNVDFNEMLAYLGIAIFMGCQRLNTVSEYWNTQPQNGAVFDLIRQSMSLVRWEQIHRYFYVNRPGHPNLRPFEKMEPLDDIIRNASQKYMRSGTHIAVDECIQGFQGRASEIVTIPSKPIPTGYKIWVKASDGYVFDFMWHARGIRKIDGPQGLDPKWQKQGFTATQAVVLELMLRNRHPDSASQVVWIDNLFTSAHLLAELRKFGIGGAGTVRTTKTKREEMEEKTQPSQSSQPSQPSQLSQSSQPTREFNRGLNQSIADIKIRHNTKIPWGALYAEISYAEPTVIQFAWKDSNVVLFMSTIHDGRDTIERVRKRPNNADAITKRTWGQAFKKSLNIPVFIDGYNHSMNGVDLADQARAECPITRRTYYTWKPLFGYLFDTALCNMAKIWAFCGHFNQKGKHGLHSTFRKLLASKLMAKTRARSYVATHGGVPGSRTVLATIVASNTSHYGRLVKGSKLGYCKACQAGSRYAAKRLKLGEISTNISKPRTPRTSFLCNQCNIALCEGGPCWQEHIDALDSQNK
jgi:hypothetical protein